MDSFITQLGVGGIFMILALREVLRFLKDSGKVKFSGNNDLAGAQTARFWEEKMSQIVKENMRPMEHEILTYLESMKQNLEDYERSVGKLTDSVNQIRENTARLLDRDRWLGR